MDVVSAARAAHAEGLAVRFSQLVFDNVDDDWSGTITDDEFGALVSSLNIEASGEVSEMLARTSSELTVESLHELVVSRVRIENITKPNLCMMCEPLARVGALRINSETLDSIFGRRTLTVQALELCGMPSEGALSISERCRLYAALWVCIAQGRWGMARGKVERNLRIFVAAAQERTLATAWSRLPAEGTLAAAFEAERTAVGLRLVHGASDEEVDSLHHNGWFTSMAGLVPEEDRRGDSGSFGVKVSFALFADALEALVQHSSNTPTPGGILLWRLYCLSRVLEGFPSGPPFAASARSGLRISKPFSAVVSTTEHDLELPELRQAHEAADEAGMACGFGTSTVPSTDNAHTIRMDMQSRHADAASRAGLRSLWESLPAYERLRSTEVSPMSGKPAPRHALSFGECFVLTPTEDEEDAAMLPLAQLAAEVSEMRPPSRPRQLPFARALRVAIMDDPCGDAALARWVFLLLADPPSHLSPSPQQYLRGALNLASKDAAAAASGGSSTPPSGEAPSAILEAGGSAVLAAVRALWYRVNLEAVMFRRKHASSHQAVFQMNHDLLANVAEGECAPWHRDDGSSCQYTQLSSTGPAAAAAAASAASAAVPTEAFSASPVLDLVGEVAADGGDPPLGVASWADVIATSLPAVASDVFPVALAAAFPPTPDKRLDLDTPLCKTEQCRGRSGAPRPPTWALPTGTDSEEVWDAATREDFAAKPLPRPHDEAEMKGVLGWDPSLPFSPAARWKAFGSILDSLPDEPVPSAMWPNPGRACGAGARGRVSVMRWCLESCCLVPKALGQGRRTAVATGLIRSGLDPVVFGLDVWATILARATFEKLQRHLTASVVRGGPFIARDFGTRGETPGHSGQGRHGPAALTAAAKQWSVEMVKLANGLDSVPATAWDTDARMRLSDDNVASWAANLFGLSGSVGWDGLLAAALWHRCESPFPRNAGAFVDLEPRPGDPTRGLDSTCCATPARTMALMTVLSQVRPAADGSFTPRGWALAAKAALARAWDLFQSMSKKVGSKPTTHERGAVWASALARALWEARGSAPSARLDTAGFLAAAAAAVEGGDTRPGHPGVVAMLARALHLSGGTLRDAMEVMHDVSGH